MRNIKDIEGIGEAYAAKLNACGITTTAQLLDRCTTAKGRKELAEQSGISDTLILKWANRADLDRIKGIGEEYSDLLELAGVDTVPELAQRNAANLLQKMTAVNADKDAVRRLPTENQVAGWIAEAKTLPRKLEY